MWSWPRAPVQLEVWAAKLPLPQHKSQESQGSPVHPQHSGTHSRPQHGKSLPCTLPWETAALSCSGHYCL